MAAFRATGAEFFMPHNIALLAAACDTAGQIEEGLTLLDDALEMSERTGERWFAAELHRHKGQSLLRRGHTEAAEITHMPNNTVSVTDAETAAKILRLVDALEDNDDVQSVSHNAEMPESVTA